MDRILRVLKKTPVFLAFLILSFLPIQVLAQQDLESPWSGKPWRLFFEIPAVYTFDKATDGSSLETSGFPTGLMVLVQTPLGLGFGIENYAIPLNDDGSAGSSQLSIKMVDLLLALPFEKLILAPGGGIGRASVEGDYSDRFEPTFCYQILLNISYQIPDLFRVSFSWHKVFSQVQFRNNDYYLETGGNMVTLGFGLEF